MAKPKKDSRDAFIESLRPAKKPAPAKKKSPVVGDIEVERKSSAPGGAQKDKNTLSPGEFKKRRDTIDMLRQRSAPKKK